MSVSLAAPPIDAVSSADTRGGTRETLRWLDLEDRKHATGFDAIVLDVGQDVAVEDPQPRLIRHHFQVVALAGTDQHRVLDQRRPFHGNAVGAHDPEVEAV